MNCLYCGRKTEVTNSRTKARLPTVWRRRQCLACVAQFTSLEQPDYTSAVAVQTSAQLDPFKRDRLFLSLYKSLGHRQDALDAATILTNTVFGLIYRQKAASNGVISNHKLADTVYKMLKRFDPLAANTYKAYHQKTLGR